MKTVSNTNPLPEVPAGQLGTPQYTNPAVASAVARCRRDGGSLYRVTAIYKGERFGYDLPEVDAKSMAIDLLWSRRHEDVTLCCMR